MKFDIIFPTIEEIKPYYRNAKMHSKTQISEIARSIKDFGFDQPIVVDQDNIIIKGHGRYYASIRLGLKNVPVIKRTDLTPIQIMASRIADNKLFELTVVDSSIHSQELDDIAKSLTTTSEDVDFLPSNNHVADPAVLMEGLDFEPVPTKPKLDSSDANYEGPGMALEDGELLVCPKCVHTFYVAEE
jgi:hypothetical protein